MKQPLQREEQNHDSLVMSVTTPLQRKTSFGVVLMLVAVVVMVIPFARLHISALPTSFAPAFVNFTSVAVSLADFITFYLLLGQFRSLRQPSVALLAAVYGFSSLVLVPYVLTFPGVYSPTGLFDANAQTALWLYVFWHAISSLGVIMYVLQVRYIHVRGVSMHATSLLCWLSLPAVTMLACCCTVIAIYAAPVLPTLIRGLSYTPMIDSGVGPLLCLITVIACLVVFFGLKEQLLLYSWLKVTMTASLMDVTLLLLSGARFSVGWYASRGGSLIAAVAVLIALLHEIRLLYEKIARQNEVLVWQQKQQDNFVAVVGHEFRTALTSIQGFSELMYVQSLPEDELREFAGDIHADAMRLNRMITDLLDLERMKSGNTSLRLERVELNNLVTEIAHHMQPHLFMQQRTLKLDLTADVLPLWCDRDKLTQLITNLLNNAIKYSLERSTIFVGTKKEDNTAHLVVRDQGAGIPREQLKNIFERYTRVEGSAVSPNAIGGTELGLAIVRQIADMHHGNVWAESELGHGSTFHVTLPLASMLKMLAVQHAQDSRRDGSSML